MATIYTKYHGPTNSLGSRISVRGWSTRLNREVRRFYGFDHSAHDAHDAAVKAWWRAERAGDGPATLVRGRTPDDRGWVYVDVDGRALTVGEG